MSSDASPEANAPEPGPEPVRGSKKRRLQGACDTCRRKKTRCDRAHKSGDCTNCVAFNIPCTQLMGKRRRPPTDVAGPSSLAAPAPPSHSKPGTGEDDVTQLRERLSKVEHLLSRLRPEPPSDHDAGTTSGDQSSNGPFLVSAIIGNEECFLSAISADEIRRYLVDVAHYARRLEEQLEVLPHEETQPTFSEETETSSTTILKSKDSSSYGSSSVFQAIFEADVNNQPPENLGADILTSHLARLSVDPSTTRFFGKSSDLLLINEALKSKINVVGNTTSNMNNPFSMKRSIFWAPRLNDFALETKPVQFIFPESDLMYDLLEIYFSRVNVMLSLLHKPTFMKNIGRGLHHDDEGFGALVLVVCAMAAIACSDDPRILTEGMDLPLSRGWKWLHQVWKIRKSLMWPHSLFELQTYCIIMHGNYAGLSVYNMVGIGLRSAQEIGVHRKNGTTKGTIEGELWRRAFWLLLVCDRTSCAFTGRPFSIQDEDYDLDMPIECDDEYWEDPDKPFIQPPGKPSIVEHLTHFIRMSRILGNTLRTIYANKRPGLFKNAKTYDWKQRIVIELDSEINKWMQSIPPHLRWDPNNPNQLWFEQSASLYTFCHFVRITIHRAFICISTSDPASLLPLIVCRNAAHECSMVVDAQRRRGLVAMPYLQVARLASGVILLLNIWTSIHTKRELDIAKEMGYVKMCMDALRFCESRWRIAGRFWDVIKELCPSEERQQQLQQQSILLSPTHTSHKRGRDEFDIAGYPSNHSTPERAVAQGIPSMIDLNNPASTESSSMLEQCLLSMFDSNQAAVLGSNTDPSMYLPSSFGGLEDTSIMGLHNLAGYGQDIDMEQFNAILMNGVNKFNVDDWWIYDENTS